MPIFMSDSVPRAPCLAGAQCRTDRESSRRQFATNCNGLRWRGSVLLGYPAGVSATPVGSRPVELEAFGHVKDERLRRLLQHWIARRAGALLPKRSAIDPTAIGPILASVWMCDYLPDGRRFRMRLVGEDINRLYGRNVTNCMFEE